MNSKQNSNAFEVVLLNGQSVQVDVEPGRTAEQIAETIARKAGIAIPPGYIPELCVLSSGKSLTGNARDLAQLFVAGNKIGLRIILVTPSNRGSSILAASAPSNRRISIASLLLVLIAVSSVLAGGFFLYKQIEQTKREELLKASNQQHRAVPNVTVISIADKLVPLTSEERTEDKTDSSNSQIVEKQNKAQAPFPGQLKWRFKTNGGVYSHPAVSDEIVYFGSYDKYFYAVNAKTGQLVWKFETNDSVWSSPAISNNIVYFGSTDNYLYAVEAKTGQKIWRFETGGPVCSSPVVSDDVVYFGSSDHYFYAVNAKTGQQKWKIETGTAPDWNSIPAVCDGVVYIGNGDYSISEKTTIRDTIYYLYAIDAGTGYLKWKFKSSSYITSSPVVSDNIIYFGTDDKYLYAVDLKSVQLKWRFKMEDYATVPPAVSEGIVYVGSNDSYLYAVDAKTGQEKWRFKTGRPIWSSPMVSNGIVYFGNIDSHLYAVDAQTGQEKWRFDMQESCSTQCSWPTVCSGIVYIGGGNSICDTYLYAVYE